MGWAESLIRDGVLKSPDLIAAFRAVSREDFVPDELRGAAATVNAPLPIGGGQTVSQPFTVAFMLELLEPKAGQKILDIGAGSGWQTALLAFIVSEQRGISNLEARISKRGKVYAMERVPELCAFGEENVAKYNFIEKGIVEWFCRDATDGLPERAPFDRIIVAAAIDGRGLDAIPNSWFIQSARGGVIVAPIGGSIWRFKKNTSGKWEQEEYPGFAFVPFVSGERIRDNG